VLVSLLSLLALTLPTQAQAALAAPYTAFFLDSTGYGGSWLLSSGQLSWDSSNATINMGPAGTLRWTFAVSTSVMPTHSWTAIVAAPTGSDFVPGLTYPTTRSADALHAGLDISGDGRGCNQEIGTMTVAEYSRDPVTSAMNAFAASFSVSCEGTMPVVTGLIRWQSTVDYLALATDKSTLAFGNQPVGMDGTPQAITITGTGSVPAVIGAAKLDTAATPDFVLTDGCAGAVLAYGQTCTVTVTPHLSALYTRGGTLTIPDNTVATRRIIRLSALGIDPVNATFSPSYLAFPTTNVGQSSAPVVVTVTSTGMVPIVFGTASVVGTDPSSFLLSADTCSLATLSPGATCQVTVTAHPTSTGAKSANISLPDNSLFGSKMVALWVNAVIPAQGTFYPMSPTRILDTRYGVGAPKAPVGPKGVIHLQVGGANGVPATGVSAVILNITVTGPTAASHLTVFPTGVSQPTTSNLNFPAGWTGANMVTIGLGTSGQVDIYNNSGNTQVIADLTGWYAANNDVLPTYGLGGEYQVAQPQRLLDTRTGGFGAVPGGYMVTVPVDYGPTVNPHIRALVVNVTAVAPTAPGHLTVWDGVSVLPNASTLNFPARIGAVPNLAVVPVTCPSCGPLPSIGIYNSSAGATHIIVDIFGLYDDGTLSGGLRFTPMTPTRIVDTRFGLGAPGALGPATSVTVTAPATVADASTIALATNVTAVAPTAATHVTVWPYGPKPNVSNLNAAKGQTVPNAVMCELSLGNTFNVFNNSGSTHVIVDVVGSFAPLPVPLAAVPVPVPLSAQHASTVDGRTALVSVPSLRSVLSYVHPPA
jgi:hypothetical protein